MIMVFNRDSVTGALTFVETKPFQSSPSTDNDETNGLAISPDGAHLYATNYVGAALTVFQRDANTGKLAVVTTYQDGIGGIDGLRYISTCRTYGSRSKAVERLSNYMHWSHLRLALAPSRSTSLCTDHPATQPLSTVTSSV